ncbi:10149_t:CDS:1, partial [Cetraspora pellucida]
KFSYIVDLYFDKIISPIVALAAVAVNSVTDDSEINTKSFDIIISTLWLFISFILKVV